MASHPGLESRARGVLLLTLLTVGACTDTDIVGASAGFGSGGSGADSDSGRATTEADGPGQDEGTGTAGGSADDTGAASASADGNEGGDVEGEACMGTQMGLCEMPGQTVHCYSGAPETCGVGPCIGGTQTCETFDLDLGEWSACEGEVLPELEVCDGLDNDCDGEVDEDLGTTDCGQGLCAHAEDDCIDGEPNACDPQLGAEAEACDGVDNDCDGDIDEDFAGQSVSCGVGQCEHLVAACVGGVEPACDPMEGAGAESCDGIDNDCDGETDEGFGTLTCGVGACDHSVDACVDGEPQVCDPFDGAIAEACDGVDNDCDGQIDEGYGTVTCGVGICAHELDVCVDGQLQVCDPTLGAEPEVCFDGVDNDCDGTVDEDCDCGNSVIDAGEACDGAALGGQTCATLGHDGGVLGCTPDCTLDDSGCWECGDGTMNSGEECDGADLGGQTCLSLGFDGGTLGCALDCTRDETGCYLCSPSSSGGLQDPSAPPPPPPPGGPGGCNDVVAELTCSSIYQGQVQSGNSSIDGPYTCGEPYAPLNQPEGEDVYSFTCQADGAVDLLLSGMDCDLDIYVLTSTCNPDSGCLEGSTAANTTNDSVTFQCTAGSTYYIVIEGYGWQNVFPPGGACGNGEGNYTLQFDTGNATGGCLEDCDDGIDNDQDGPIDCADSDCATDPVCKTPCPP